MRKYIVIAVFAISGMILGFAAQIATAATTNCQTSNGETTCVSLSQYAKSSSSATATGAVRVNTAAKVEGEFISATGFHPTHPTAATTHYIPVGTWYQNSFRNRDGHLQYFTDRCGDSSPYTHPLTSGPHKGYCMFYYDTYLHVWRKPDCGNFVKFPGPLPKLTFTSVVIFKTFAEIKWNVTVRLNEAGKAYATASAQATGCYASSSAWANGSGYVYVHVYVYAKYSSSAKLSGPGHVTSTQELQAQASVETNITVSVRATATAWCQVTPPSPSFSCTGISATPNSQTPGELNYTFSLSAQYSNTTITGSKFTVLSNGNVIATPTSNTLSAQYGFPSQGSYTVEGQVVTSDGTTPVSSTCTTSVTIQSPPPTVTVTKINDVPAGGTSPNFCSTPGSLGTHYATVKIVPVNWGSFADPTPGGTRSGSSSITWSTVADGEQVCATYVGPNDPTSGTLIEKVDVIVTDNVTGLQVVNSQTFNVNTQPSSGRP